MRKRHYSESPLKTAIQKRGSSWHPQSEIVVYNARSEGVNSEIPPDNLFSRDDSDGAMQMVGRGRQGGERVELVARAQGSGYTFGTSGKWSGFRGRKKEADAKP